MKRMVACLILAAVSTVALAQVSTVEQAREKLRIKRELRMIAATQPATHEELDDLWTEVNKLKNEVQGLRDELAQMQREAELRRGTPVGSQKPADRRGPAHVSTPTPPPGSDN